ncbi:hypothetical protein NDA13_002385 [Ustilago tritici]|nr:hypothetical protein NDA13_002385 [Ustilago tritici]
MPTRGGARGGAAEFSWDKVKESKDREFYLGNSVAAPTGRWQDGRDINWYNKDASTSSSAAADERREELRKIKEAETAALYAKLGKPPPAPRSDDGLVKVGERLASGSAGAVRREVTGANGAPLEGNKSRTWGKGSEEAEELSEADKKLARKFARNEVRRRRAETGEDNGERRRSRKDEESHHHSSGRRRRDDDEDRERRHGRSHRHRDNELEEKESRRYRHHHSNSRRSCSRSRSRSRSPESSSYNRHSHHRYRYDDRHRSKHSREKDAEDTQHRSSSHREPDHGRSRQRSDQD